MKTAFATIALATASVAQNSVGCETPEKYTTCTDCLAAGCAMSKSDTCMSMCPMDVSCWGNYGIRDSALSLDDAQAQCQLRQDLIDKDAVCEEQTTCDECSAKQCMWGVYSTLLQEKPTCINYGGAGMLPFTPSDCQAVDPCAGQPCPDLAQCPPGTVMETTPPAPGECCNSYKCVLDCTLVRCPGSIDCPPDYTLETRPPADGECCDRHECVKDCSLAICPMPMCEPGKTLETSPPADGECCDRHECVKDCSSFPCPVIDCQPGFTPKSSPPLDGECCDRYECIEDVKPCDPALCPVIDCKPGHTLKTSPAPDGECCDRQECFLDCSSYPCAIPMCQPGYTLKTSPPADGECCDRHECVKDVKDCSSTPCPVIEIDCQPGFTSKSSPPLDGECCDRYECVQDCTLVRCAGIECKPGYVAQSSPPADGECCGELSCVAEPEPPVDCSLVKCADPDCPDGTVSKTLDGKCCPECVKVSTPTGDGAPTTTSRDGGTAVDTGTVAAASGPQVSLLTAGAIAVATSLCLLRF